VTHYIDKLLYSFVLDVNNFVKFQLWLVTFEPFGGKIQNFIEKSEIYQRFGKSNKKMWLSRKTVRICDFVR
jgi:hypothetical protein